MPEPQVHKLSAPKVESPDLAAWIEALQLVAGHYKLPFSTGGIRLYADAMAGVPTSQSLDRLAAKHGLGIHVVPATARTPLTSTRLPLIVQMKDGAVGVVTALSSDRRVAVAFSGDGGRSNTLPLDDLMSNADILVIARPARSAADERVDAYIAPYREHWFRKLALRDIGAYWHVIVASLVANVLTLTGIFFSMQVYDRVVPAHSYPTLYVLFGGVLIAIGFDFAMRRLRSKVIDMAGKRTDLAMSDLVFGHALRVKNQARPKSVGTFIAQLRDLEQVRELLTSTTLSAIADLPFFFLFLGLYFIIGGWLAIVPIAALVVMLLPGFLVQRKLRACATEAMRESSLRNAMLVEAVQGIEDIKMLQAEDQLQRRWNHFNAISGQAQLKLRGITNSLGTWSHSIQMAVYATVIFVGAPLVMKGDMTTGALVACSILGSRMIAPMSQLSHVLGRLQQAKVGLKSLDSIMELPTDYPEEETRIAVSTLHGRYQLKDAVFQYSRENGPPALTVETLSINAGERLAILGKNGAGKSTLLLAMAGMIEQVSGEVLLDDLALGHIDPADLRRNVGLLTQNSRLFHGTIRENVTMGAVNATPAAILDALSMVGADEFIARLPQGLDYPILEGGRGLSGGQQQALLLARLFIRNPEIVLLDEPTASMDEATERKFIAGFQQWSAGKTVAIATHRMRVLDLTDRIVAIDNGRIALDARKEAALQQLRGVSNVVQGDAAAPLAGRNATAGRPA